MRVRPASERVVVVLPGSRLLVDELLLEPGTEHTLVRDGRAIHGQFMAAEAKEVCRRCGGEA